MKPALNAYAALLSRSTGIIDSHGLMLALQGDAESADAMIAFDARVVRGAVANDGLEFEVMADEQPMWSRARTVINSAGLFAADVAARIEGLLPEHVPRRYFAKGSYFVCTGRVPFSHLVYPVREPGGLGVHLTLDLAGQARFGPNVEWIDAIDYTVDGHGGGAFYSAVRRYWPGLPDGALTRGFARRSPGKAS